ncbi:type I DNA topoisomerase [Labrys monachus]|uniref:DNA topoisomerase 1 n=1 Tax=Labrys monachus TaxID=217067 RepID=A0ABU0FEL3_9HYPH|nr:type I DNA topoisomerase [Labrys monachus]MDQ0393054.1 DNA topoisomerase-1 [Labrys monachus]
MPVVIVESPAKAQTINKYLGPGYQVIASYGHVRDLPAKDGSVEPDADFAMIWENDAKASKRLSEIAKAVRASDKLILATDPDREGEAISWHVLEILREKRAIKDIPVERVTFNAITKDAVLKAMKSPRDIDEGLVDAYLARRALDYLVGFRLSPVLWRKLPGARSAGRVQSVALRLVCDRELEIERFVAREYWSLVATLATPRGDVFDARLVGADGKKIQRLDVGTEQEALAFRAALDQGRYVVTSVEAKPAKRHPFPPFTTSTLQQEASRKFGMSPNRTMQIAQRLYEGVAVNGETVGLITYMRTDGVEIAPEAIASIRQMIGNSFAAPYLPGAPRRYTTKAKNAQEAHEAIRPTDPTRAPQQVSRFLEPEQAKLYELIWKRTVASQMESAELERTTVDILVEAGGRKLDLRASGQVVKFDGFLTLYNEDRDDDGDDDDSKRLPAMSAGEPLTKKAIAATQHFTEPPPRFSEATLIKRMEELGIGRPSTYAATLATLRDREYVSIDKKRLKAEDKGRLVTAFLESFFARYVEYDFTAALEEELDRISNHELDWKQVLRDFWRDFSAALENTKDLRTTQVLDALNELLGPHIFPDRGDGSNPRVCTVCGTGTLSLKLGKYGAFIGCSNYPECRYTRQLSAGTENGGEGENGGEAGTKKLGADPVSGQDVTVRDGRFGPYVQLGEGEKPKRVSLPKGIGPGTIDLERALALLALPKEVATHPDTGKPIVVGIGRFGPYVQHEKTYANLEKDDDVLAIGANRAVDLIVTKETKGPGRRFGAAAAAGRVLGDYPGGGEVQVKPGRYGAYVTNGKVNATLPKGMEADAVTLAQAIEMIAAKGGGAKAAGAKARTTKAPGTKTAASKTAGTKTAAAKSAAKDGPVKKAPAKKAAAAGAEATETAAPAAKRVAGKAAPKKAGKAILDSDDVPFDVD